MAKNSDWLFWVLMTLLGIWIILIAAGVFQSPPVIEAAPFGFIFTLLLYLHKMHEKRLNSFDLKFDEIKSQISEVKAKTEIILELIKER